MAQENFSIPTRDSALIGVAGVHYVVSELSLRGLIALPTIRNTAGVDVIVSDKKGSWHANLQVKTSRSKVSFWPISKKYKDWVDDNNYYVFLRFNEKIKSFEVFLESSKAVADLVTCALEQEKLRNVKEWAPCYYPKDKLEKIKIQWQEFGL